MNLLARIVVRIAAFIPPRRDRARWREEWLGEIEGQRAEDKGQKRGRRGKGEGWKTLRAALGAPRDALSMRVTSMREAVRALDAGWRTDVRQAARSLWHSPAHVATVVICLGIGAAVTVSVFSALNALLFGDMPGITDRRSLGRLFVGHETTEGIGPRRAISPGPLSTSDFEILDASRPPALSSIAAEGDWPFAVLLDREPVTTSGAFVSGDYFAVLGTTPAAGRLLRAEDDRAGALPVAVVGYHLWRERLGGDVNIVGRSILVTDRSFTVVGVAPPGFAGVHLVDIGDSPLNYAQLWIPLRHAAAWPGVPAREAEWHSVIGRLAPGETYDTAGTAMATAAVRLAAAYPDTRRGAKFILRPLGFGPNDGMLDILLVVAVLLSMPLTVLLIGCANVANLQLARATERARELSVRFALGASRAQLIRLLTCEAGALAILAVGAGWLGAEFIIRIGQPAFPLRIALDGRVLAFAVLLIVGVTFLSGLAPAWWGTRRAELLSIKQATRTGGVSHARLRHALVVIQMALSLALLTTSGLFMASLRAMRGEVPPAARNTLVSRVDVDTLNYTSEETRRLRDEVMTRLAAHPRVESVSAERRSGLRYWSATDPIESMRYTSALYVTTSWFPTVDARIVAGRLFQPSDAGAAVVVSERMAREIAPTGSAVGAQISLTNSSIISRSPDRIVLSRPGPGQAPENPADRFIVEIVGVVADIPRRPGDARPDPVVYLPLPPAAAGLFTLRVRTHDPDGLAPQIRDVISHADRRLAVTVESAETLFLRESGPVRMMALSIGGLGVVALLLAAGGLYAVMAYLVSLRRQEIGVRLAIGARPADVLQLVLRQGIRLAIVGSVAGLAITTPITMALRAGFVGVSPFDPTALLPPAAILVVVALMASAIPARRAARIDPIRALRED